jgi:hypothetical protein
MRNHPSRQHVLRLLRDEFPPERLISLTVVYRHCYGPAEDPLEQQTRRDEVMAASDQRSELISAVRRIEREHLKVNQRAYKTLGGNGHVPEMGYFLAFVCLSRGINPE